MILISPCIAKALLVSGMFFHGLKILHCGFFLHMTRRTVFSFYTCPKKALTALATVLPTLSTGTALILSSISTTIRLCQERQPKWTEASLGNGRLASSTTTV